MSKQLTRQSFIELVGLVKTGLTPQAIANALGVEYAAAIARMSKLGGYRNINRQLREGKTPEQIVDGSERYAPRVKLHSELEKPSPNVQAELSFPSDEQVASDNIAELMALIARAMKGRNYSLIADVLEYADERETKFLGWEAA